MFLFPLYSVLLLEINYIHIVRQTRVLPKEVVMDGLLLSYPGKLQ